MRVSLNPCGVQVRQEDLDKETPYQSRILGQTTNQNSFVL